MEEYINKKYNRLLIIKRIINNKSRHILVECKCDCGNIKITRLDSIIRNKTTSCGCKNLEHCYKSGDNIIHGMSKDRFYIIYYKMYNRCNNIKHIKYNNYGGRGIKLLWNTFMDFKNDMYESYIEHINKYGEKQTTIDRINNDDNYYKENCRWATYSEQNKNRRHLI